MKMKRILTAFFLLLLATGIGAQSKSVSGSVKDSDGHPLPGVTVVIKGTTKGTISDTDGRYHISDVPETATLVFSFVGMETQEVRVGSQGVINVTLSASAIGLEEVVAIGYGTVKKSDLTSSITTVKGGELSKMTTGNSAEALQGKAAGVQIVQSGGHPGAAPKIIIRGVTTNQGTDPLIVLDGIPLGSGTNLNFLNPNDIESMQILKDASATSIYGSRGSNGVILVTTKRGKVGEALITANASFGLMHMPEIESANATEYAKVVNARRTNDGASPLYDNPDALGAGTNWWSEVLNSTAPIANIDLGVSGGKEGLTFSGNLGYFNQKSHYTKGYYEKLTGRFNIDYKINEKLTFKQDISPRIQRSEPTPNLLWNILRIDPITEVYKPQEEQEGLEKYDIYSRSANAVPNPVAAVERQFNKSNLFQFFSNSTLSYKPIPGLTLSTQFGLDITNWRNDRFSPKYFIDPQEQNEVNKVFRQMSNQTNWVSNNTINYQTEIAKHSINVLGGVVLEKFRYNYLSGSRENVPLQNEELYYLDAAMGEGISANGNESVNSLFSLLGRVVYNYDRRYYLTAALRRDGSSRFPKENKWGTFPSISFSWDVSQEHFFNVSSINSLRLKLGYGQVGNQEVPNNGRFFAVNDGNYALGGIRVPTAFLSQFGNEALKWETVEDLNFGIEGAVLDNKLSFSIERFQKKSKDLLFPVKLPQYTGLPSNVWQNIGNFKSDGWDANIAYRSEIKDFTYHVALTFSTNKSIVERLAPGNDVLYGQKRADLGNRFLKISEVGEVVGLLYGYETDGIFNNQAELDAHVNADGDPIQADAQLGDIKFIDQADEDGMRDGVIDDNDMRSIGNPFPDFVAGLNVDLSYKNWDFNMQWYGTFGNDVFNYTTVFRHSGTQDVNVAPGTLDRVWSENNTGSNVPRLTMQDLNGNYQVPSDYFIEDGSYFRLKNLQIGYSPSISGMKKLRTYISAQNLLTLTKYSGFDPEVLSGSDIINGYGIDYAAYAPARTFILGLQLTF